MSCTVSPASRCATGVKRKAVRMSGGQNPKRACDVCHARKVKCDGSLPCGRCRKSDGDCTYLNPIRPKGPLPRGDKGISVKRQRVGEADSSPGWSVRPHSTTNGVDISSWQTQLPSPPIYGGYGISPSSHLAPDDAVDPSLNAEAPSAPENEPLGLLEAFLDSCADIASTGLTTHQPPAAPGPSQISGPHNSLIHLANQPISLVDASFALPPRSPTASMFPIPRSETPTLALWRSPAHVEDISPLLTLTLDNLIKPQLEIFFDRIYPMIPIYSSREIFARLQNPAYLRNETFVSMILSMAALSLIHPLHRHEVSQRHTRAKQAKLLMDEACMLRARWDHGCLPTVEGILTSFCMFGTLFELGQPAGARMRLKEAVAMGEAMRLDNVGAYVNLPAHEAHRRHKLFWMLAVTERAYALQRSGNLVFGGHIPSFPSTTDDATDTSGNHIRLLAKVFSYVNQDIVHCWNSAPAATAPALLTKATVVRALSELSGSANKVFGDDAALHSLSEAQKADLLITWQWLRNRIWKLAHTHGLTVEGAEPELSVEHVVEIASTSIAICQRLSIAAMEEHGTGFVEKLYDIASIITDLLQSNQVDPSVFELVQGERWTGMLATLTHFVSSHRAGVDFTEQLAGAARFASNVKLLMAPNASV